MLALAAFAALAAAAPASVVAHEITLDLAPDDRRLVVVDRVRVPPALVKDGVATFVLHAGLAPTGGDGAKLVGTSVDGYAVPAERFTVRVGADGATTLTYGGVVDHPPTQVPTEYQRSFQESPGTVDPRGVYLSGATLWIPRFGDELVVAKVTARALPAGWSLVAGGDGVHPVDDLHVAAGPFVRFAERVGDVEVTALLRADDRALAQRYLEVSGQYLQMYEALIGDYPWRSFALVENFWETGYGFPAFTLLGPKIVRFPFILHTSYPHELLHNWWGNGVYVAGGNWCEGLTAYLADHLVAEQKGGGATYRRDTISKYMAFVNAGADFPLQEFRGRFSAASEAVGYGKWMMVLHMLRTDLGDAVFVDGLRRFYAANKYARATFDDVRVAFEQASGRDLGAFFAAWVGRTGLPSIAWREARAAPVAGGWRVDVVLEQTQAAAPYPVVVPVVVTTGDGASTTLRVRMDDRVARASIVTAARPARVDVDPQYDVFRRLEADEIPPAMTQSLGAERLLFVLPTQATDDEREAWRGFAAAICGPERARCQVSDDVDVPAIPKDRAVWILGYGNRLRAAAAISSKRFGGTFDDRRFVVGGEKRENADTSVAIALRHPSSRDHGMAFVAADRVGAVAGLAKKLPHYGKYGYLGFAGDEPTNVMKGQWEAKASPMTARLAAVEVPPALPKRAALASLPPPFSADRMQALVRELSSKAYDGRGWGTPGLTKATTRVGVEMRAAGLAPYAGAYEHCFDDGGARGCNVLGVVPGADPSLPAVVLAAHVDHLGKGRPGADDNASGVAVLLEVARALSATKPLRSVVFAAFTGEETGLRGSRRFVAQHGADKLFAIVNLDTVGRRGAGGLQVLDGRSAREWVHVFRGIGFTTGVPATLVDEGGGASDQQAFLEKGVPGVQLFGGLHTDWHKATDTAEKVTDKALVDTAVVAREAIAYLADRREPLSAAAAATATGGPQRTASLGSVPDFEHTGGGVRFADVVAGSAAAHAGLRKGDVLVAFDGQPIADLRAYSNALKTKQPGDKVRVKVKRGGEDVVVDVVLGAR